jgi:hypothetical protein
MLQNGCVRRLSRIECYRPLILLLLIRRDTQCSATCRLIIVILAAVLGAFTDNLSNDLGDSHLIVVPPSIPGTSRPRATLPYPLCDSSVGGLSTLDLCVMSVLSYSNDTAAAVDTAAWFGAANASASLLWVGRFDTGLRMNAYNVTGAPPLPPGGTVVVVTRGSRTMTDFAQVGLRGLTFLLRIHSSRESAWP